MQVALGLAAYQAAGPDNMTKDHGHMGKTFQVATANRNGTTAALLARKGCHVPLDILDGPLSLFDAFLETPDAGAEMMTDLARYSAITDAIHQRYAPRRPTRTYPQRIFRWLPAR